MAKITSALQNNLLVLDLACKNLHVFKQFVKLTWLNFLRSKDANIVLSDQVCYLLTQTHTKYAIKRSKIKAKMCMCEQNSLQKQPLTGLYKSRSF